MLLYNVTVGIDKEVEQEWLAWMKAQHIPDVLATGMFSGHKIYKILHDNEDETTTSYSIQYFAPSIEHVLKYLEEFAPRLVDEHQRRFKDRHVAFRTLLEEI